MTRRQRELIALLIIGNSLSFSVIADLWQVNGSIVQKHFDNLKAKEGIRRMGPDKGRFWDVLIKL